MLCYRETTNENKQFKETKTYIPLKVSQDINSYFRRTGQGSILKDEEYYKTTNSTFKPKAPRFIFKHKSIIGVSK